MNDAIRTESTRRRTRVGFTLIEVLLVIGILVVLGTVGVVVYSNVREGANEDMARAMVDDTERAVELFYNDMNTYPGEEGFAELMQKPEDEKLAERWNGPYLEKVPVDPWGGELKYEKVEVEEGSTGPKFHIWSNGPDGEEGTEDDIRNWETDSE